MAKKALRRAKLMASQRRFWKLALIPVLTLVAMAEGVPFWGLGLLLTVQAVLVWLVLRDVLQLGARLEASGHAQLRPREELVSQLADQGLGADDGATAAALTLRLDSAKRLGDQLGRTQYAALMDTLCDRLGLALRDQDLFCATGEDGFGVALFAQRGLDAANVLAVAQRVQARLAAPVSIDGASIWPSVSVGFCLSPRAAMLNGLDMLEASEVAASKAVQSGPAGLSGYSVVDFPASISGDRIAALRRALDNGEIRAYFQPQVRTDTGEVSGLEALARWEHPQSGLISPGEFLPQIEAAGLSPKLAETMLRQALGTLRTLEMEGLSVPSVSINLSAEELRNPRLADEIGWELDRHDLAPERLTVEILETVVAKGEADTAVRTIARLATMGCGIDLDDFGTGHASITNIRRFAVNRLKIDRSFVTNMHIDPEQQRMVAAILSMAEQLGLATLAEGVEHPEEQVKLAQMGCGHLQGFAIARPMPADALPGWLRAQAGMLQAGEPWVEDPVQARAASNRAAE
ncbi:bifunctional diguanylate cyclase/phosphodiesterase [Cereibacter sphaeroides]|nr:bifunctional diguanylate cyclase/phosphodiesterase [Cereibacter sphaeroides]